MSSLLVQLAWVIFFVWLAGGVLTLVGLARMKFLRPSGGAGLTSADAPLVSIIIPARNEERRVLAECVRSILAQDYGNFEVVAVNDRSTDATGQILRSLARGDARLRILEGTEIPAGWLGKPHALQQALQAARGRWVLATDADMIFHPAALRTAVAYALEHDCDGLTFIPHFEALSFWERVFIPTWGWMMVLTPPELIKHPKSPLAVGIGGFFLLRRAPLERLGGFGAVRAEVLEDMRLAELLKGSGARVWFEHAPGLVRTRMYASLAELWEGATKNWFAILRFSPALTAATLAWISLVALLPPVVSMLSALMLAAGAPGESWRQLFVPSFLSHALFVALLALVGRRFGMPALYALTAPLGFALSCAIMVSSAFGVLTGRGVTWKGRKVYERAGVRPPRP